MEFRNHRLENGLEIVAETNDDAHSMSVAFLVRTGSRDETGRSRRREPFPGAHVLQGHAAAKCG